MSEFWIFLAAVASQWVVLMTGGVVTACLTVLQWWRQKTFSWRFHRWVIGGFIAFACFLAWRDEYRRAQGFLTEKATLEGRLQTREYPLEELRRLQTANRQLEAALRVTHHELAGIHDSLKVRRLSPDERAQFTAALAAHDGSTIGGIPVRAYLSCHECIIYGYDIVSAINSIPGWSASGGGNGLLRPDFVGLGIGVKDRQSLPLGASVLGSALRAAGLPFTIETLDFLSPDTFMFVVGNKP